MGHLILALTPEERWLTLLGLIAAILGLLGTLVRVGWKVFRAVDGQLEAMDANTRALRDLTKRVDALEANQADPHLSAH